MAPSPPNALTVYVFNVGQGDHLLIEFPNGEYGIIDFYHESPPPLNLHRSPVLYFLERRRAAAPSKPIRIRFVHLTHPDLDHTKGVIEFLEWIIKHEITLHEFWLFAGLSFKSVVTHFKRALEDLPAPDEKLKYRAQKINDRLERLSELIAEIGCEQKAVVGPSQLAEIGKDSRVVAIAPLGSHIDDTNQKVLDQVFTLILQDRVPKSSHNNLMSSVIMIKYATHSLLFGADTGNSIWNDSLDFYRKTKQTKPHGECRGNFIKVSHHGSKESSSIKLWRTLLCEDAQLAISAGRRKKPKHPDPRTLKEIIRAGKSLRTPPQVVSTNMCSECLGQSETKVKLVNWFSSPDPKKSRDVETVTTLVRAKGVTEDLTPPEFAGYIYRFTSDEDRIKLTKAVTTTNPTTSPCLYRKKAKQRFPHCVYS